MTVAIKRANGDLIWFDAITNFGEKYSGSLSSHPLESGSVVNDHTTINNTKIQLNGIISDADFNFNRPIITADDATKYGINNKTFVNNHKVTDGPLIFGEVNKLTKLLPESITQFAGTQVPEVELFDGVEGGSGRIGWAAKLKAALIDMQQKAENFSLLDFNSGKITRQFTDCVLVDLDFSETPETGDETSIFPVMQIECAKYATTQETRVKVLGRKTATTAAAPSTSTDASNTPKDIAQQSSVARSVSDSNSTLGGLFKSVVKAFIGDK